MSLLRLLNGHLRPHRFSNLHEEWFPRQILQVFDNFHHRQWDNFQHHFDLDSTISRDNQSFQVQLDVQKFKPEEITIKTTGNTITVEGKHEEKEDENGMISRHFVRKFVLPKGHDVSKCVSKLTSDGILSISAPRIEITEEPVEIPIQFDENSRKLEDKSQHNKDTDK